jgi:vacuolar protein sorting-associated protein VTA1
VLSLASKVFLKADNEDRAGTASAYAHALWRALSIQSFSCWALPSVCVHASLTGGWGRLCSATVRTFAIAASFFEVLKAFGPLPAEVVDRIRYAKWKAADINKALREGRQPVPGPPGGGDGFDLGSGMSSGDEGGAPLTTTIPAAASADTAAAAMHPAAASAYVPPPTHAAASPYAPPPAAALTPMGHPDVGSWGSPAPPGGPAAFVPTTTPYAPPVLPPTPYAQPLPHLPPQPQPPALPTPAPRAPPPGGFSYLSPGPGPTAAPASGPSAAHAPAAAPRAPAAPQSLMSVVPTVGTYDPAVLTQAGKFAKFAQSALQYEDVPSAIDNLEKALALLRNGPTR